jgi:hypothetical protein
MLPEAVDWREQVSRDGFTILRGVFAAPQVEQMCLDLDAALGRDRDGHGAMRGEAGVYAARNLLRLWPALADLWRQPPLPDALGAVLGPQFGLVRALFFDKLPQQTWALPWHKDLTIAVRDNRLPSSRFNKPTTKAGVPHVEAPPEVLETMLTARIHLDEVTEENGPLKVIPGSQRSGMELQLGDVPPCSILVERGDVLLMRPLVAHCSNRSHPDTRRRRRIIHLEFAANPTLPDGYAWHEFVVPGTESASRPLV